MSSREQFVPGRAAVARKLRLDEGPKAAAFCSVGMCAQVTPWLEKEPRETHLHWLCRTGARIWWILAMELCNLCISQTLYCKNWWFQHPWGDSFSNSQIPLFKWNGNVKWQRCLIYK